MLPKFKVLGDSSANPFFSSSIIVNNLNKGAQKIGLFDENGKTIVYSTTANQMGHNADAILCVYETVFPMPVLQNALGKPLIGCSLHNLFFITDVYPENLSAYCHLGVDSELFKPKQRNYHKEKIRFLIFSESNARNGLDSAIYAFGMAFKGRTDVELYIKDRGATDVFKAFVERIKHEYRVLITHDTENTQDFEQIKQIYQDSDFQINVSRSSTWNMPALEGMSMGLPLIGINYTGMSEYLKNGFNGFEVPFELMQINQETLDILAGLGCRNHMFPLSSYVKPPYWAQVHISQLIPTLVKAANMSMQNLSDMARNARTTAQQFTWEKAAVSLSMALHKICAH